MKTDKFIGEVTLSLFVTLPPDVKPTVTWTKDYQVQGVKL